MKKIKRKYFKNIVAGGLVACMALVDTLLAVKTGSGASIVEVEEHAMTEYFADGNYNGTDSSFEIACDEDEMSSGTVSCYNILEIVRGEGLGTFGYFIDGWEPMPVEGAEMKHAYMDAIMNEVCGDPDQNKYKELPTAFRNFSSKFSAAKRPFELSSDSPAPGYYTGYYKYVGSEKGVYALVSGSLDKENFKAKMKSKFYNSGTGYDYIWVDSDQTATQLKNSGTLDLNKDIIVQNHRKYKYVNKNMFFNQIYTPQEYDKNAAENSRYSGSSYDEWKETHKVNLKTITCAELKDEDIEWADLIIFSNSSDDYAKEAYNIYKLACPDKGSSLPSRDSLPELKLKDFHQAFLIYDRIVAREDASIIFDVKSVSAGAINTDFKKLLAMLFRVNKIENKNGVNQVVNYAGRDMFMDYLPYYVDKNMAPGQQPDGESNKHNHQTEVNGYMYQDFPRDLTDKSGDRVESDGYYYDKNRNKVDSKPPYYFKMDRSNTTDYIYISTDGKFMVSDDNCERIYFNDWEGNNNNNTGWAHRVVSWYNNLMPKSGSNEWPFDTSGTEGDDYLKYWWFSKDVTDQGCHIPIYYQYYGWGGYRALRQGNDIPEDSYKNEAFGYENVLHNTDIVSDAVNGRKKKREYEDETHVETKDKKYFFLSLNIENGDGVNKTQKGNKVMYINDYEVSGRTDLPINFKLRTSENIAKIELFRKGVTDTDPVRIALYEPKATNDITALDKKLEFTKSPGGTGLKLIYDPNKQPDVAAPNPDTAHHNLRIYTFGTSKDISDAASRIWDIKTADLTGVNTKFILRASIETPAGDYKSVDDVIYVVKRNFFTLE